MRYTEKDVKSLCDQVEKAFTSQLAKAESISLAKSEDGESHKEEHKEKPEHEQKPEHEAKEHDSEEHEGKEHEEHAPEGEQHEGHDYDEEDMAHMEKMYRSMSKGELAAHHGCIQKCMGGGAGMSKAEISACEPKNTPGAKSPASKAEGNK